MLTGASTLDFGPQTEGCALLRADEPEYAVAIDESMMRQLCKQNALELREPIYFGGWCGRTSSLSYQDIVLLRKKL